MPSWAQARSPSAIRRDGENRVTVAVAGEVDLATAPQLDACLRDLAGNDVIVDLAGVPFIDSSALSVLATNHSALQKSGHTLTVVGEQDNVRKVLEVTCLLEILQGDGQRRNPAD